MCLFLLDLIYKRRQNYKLNFKKTNNSTIFFYNNEIPLFLIDFRIV